jgi:hypothetical protein
MGGFHMAEWCFPDVKAQQSLLAETGLALALPLARPGLAQPGPDLT